MAILNKNPIKNKQPKLSLQNSLKTVQRKKKQESYLVLFVKKNTFKQKPSQFINPIEYHQQNWGQQN